MGDSSGLRPGLRPQACSALHCILSSLLTRGLRCSRRPKTLGSLLNWSLRNNVSSEQVFTEATPCFEAIVVPEVDTPAWLQIPISEHFLSGATNVMCKCNYVSCMCALLYEVFVYYIIK